MSDGIISRIQTSDGKVYDIAGTQVQADWSETSATSSSYIKNKPTLGSAAATDSSAYATAAQGTKADSAVQSVKIGSTEYKSGTNVVLPAYPDTSSFITKAVNDLTNYYKKSETYTQTEINSMISAIPKFSIEVVDELPDTDISYTTVYLLKTSITETGNLYTEYIYIKLHGWEKLGTQTVDLSGYVPTTRTINGKALSSDIILSASDVNALPSSTIIPTVTDTYSATSSDAMSGKAVASAISGKQASLSDVQMNAVNSGITSTKVSIYDEYASQIASKGTYSKPSGGIPKTDLASAVQTSLDKADTALQSHQDISGKANTSGTYDNINSGMSKKLQTYKQNSTTETYGTQYPVYAQWRDGRHVKMKCDGYTTEIDYADNAGTVNGLTVQTAVPANAKFTDTTYSSKAAASGGTDVSLVTTGEKATWNAKTSNTGTVTSVAVKMNGSTKGTVTSSGTIDLGTVLTSHQDVSGKLDKSGGTMTGNLTASAGLVIPVNPSTTPTTTGSIWIIT